MKFTQQPEISLEPLDQVSRSYLAAERDLLSGLAQSVSIGDSARSHIQQTAADLVRAVRRSAANEGGLDAFMQQYDLSSDEGVLLMCIAEALLRIPDSATADRLIADKLASAKWKEHLGASDSTCCQRIDVGAHADG